MVIQKTKRKYTIKETTKEFIITLDEDESKNVDFKVSLDKKIFQTINEVKDFILNNDEFK